MLAAALKARRVFDFCDFFLWNPRFICPLRRNQSTTLLSSFLTYSLRFFSCTIVQWFFSSKRKAKRGAFLCICKVHSGLLLGRLNWEKNNMNLLSWVKGDLDCYPIPEQFLFKVVMNKKGRSFLLLQQP